MKFPATLSAGLIHVGMNMPALILLVSQLSPVHSRFLDCSSPLMKDCLGSTDIRYNPDVSNSLADQDELWESASGLWINPTIANLDMNGNPLQPNAMLPYTQSTYVTFLNRTIVGSRAYLHLISVYMPAVAEFCAQPVPPGFDTVLGGGKCGETGYAVAFDYFGASTYEKDGTLRTFYTSASSPYNYSGPALDPSIANPIGSDSIYYHAGQPGGIVLGFTEVFANTERSVIGGSSTNVNLIPSSDSNVPSLSHNIYNLTRAASEEEWVAAIQAAYAEANILPEDQFAVPMTLACLSNPDTCPKYATDEAFCSESLGQDPTCTKGPYEEPPPSMKPGAIVGFVVLGLVFLLTVLYFWHRRIVSRKEQSMRKMFVSKVAKRVDLRGSVSQLPPERLAEEFHRIDKGLRESGKADGYISREEMWEFVSSGKAGEMSEGDFNALYDAIDTNGDGRISFVEFCAYFASCAGEVRQYQEQPWQQKGEQNRDNATTGGSRNKALLDASMRISSLRADAACLSELDGQKC